MAGFKNQRRGRTGCLPARERLAGAALSYEEEGAVPWVDGATAIWVAAFRGHRDLLELLYRKGADLGVEAYCGKEERALEDEERCTPRRIAELKQSNKTVTLIDLLEGKSPDESEK